MKLKNVKVGARVEVKRDYECGTEAGMQGSIVSVDLSGHHHQTSRVLLDNSQCVWFPHDYLRIVK
jgi:hypothetical protein